MANHSSTRTTQLYDRRTDELTLDEVEQFLDLRLDQHLGPLSGGRSIARAQPRRSLVQVS